MSGRVWRLKPYPRGSLAALTPENGKPENGKPENGKPENGKPENGAVW
jgi:hypothetical protein